MRRAVSIFAMKTPDFGKSSVAIFKTSLFYQGVWGKRIPSASTTNQSEA